MSLDIEDARDFMIGIYLLAFGIFGAVTEFWYLSAAGAARPPAARARPATAPPPPAGPG